MILSKYQPAILSCNCFNNEPSEWCETVTSTRSRRNHGFFFWPVYIWGPDAVLRGASPPSPPYQRQPNITVILCSSGVFVSTWILKVASKPARLVSQFHDAHRSPLKDGADTRNPCVKFCPTLCHSTWPIHQVWLRIIKVTRFRLSWYWFQLLRYYGEGSRPYPNATNSYILGLCTGSFAASAICTSQTLTELVPAGIEAVIVAFRTGLRSLELRNAIEGSNLGDSRSWSVIASAREVEAAEMIESFSSTKVRCYPKTEIILLTISIESTCNFPAILELRSASKCDHQRPT